METTVRKEDTQQQGQSQEEQERQQAWQALQEVPSYVERIQQYPALFDTERH